MRKFIFILVAVVVANFTSAQIQKVGVVQGHLMVYTTDNAWGDVLYSLQKGESNSTITLYNLSGAFIQEYKTININKVTAGNFVQVEHMSKNYFTTDGKICFLYHEYSGSYPNFVVHKCQIIDEDGNVVFNITEKPFYEGSCIYKINGTYYLILEDILITPYNSHIYALPGNGEGSSTDISSPSAPERRKNAKLISRDGQVLIQSGDKEFSVIGQQL